MTIKWRGAGVLGVLLLLSACSGGAPAEDPAKLAARAASMAPSDAHLAQLYASSCKACHGQPGTGAPLVGDHGAWKPRADKGINELLKNVALGYKGMPAGGQCFSCSAADYRALIAFMADQPIPEK